MKVTRLMLITLCVLGLQLPGAHAQLFHVKTYEVAVKGTSSLHDWESSIDRLEAKGSFILTNNTLSDLRGVVVKIPVNAIKSQKGKLMDNKTWEAFHYVKNPLITFVLTGYRIDAVKNTVTGTGMLTMAGVTRTINVNLNYKILDANELKITGTKTLLLSDFKMERPTAMMGTIKVGDQVLVTYEFVLALDNTL